MCGQRAVLGFKLKVGAELAARLSRVRRGQVVKWSLGSRMVFNGDPLNPSAVIAATSFRFVARTGADGTRTGVGWSRVAEREGAINRSLKAESAHQYLAKLGVGGHLERVCSVVLRSREAFDREDSDRRYAQMPMSSDYALLFATSNLPRKASWNAALRELRGLGASLRGPNYATEFR